MGLLRYFGERLHSEAVRYGGGGIVVAHRWYRKLIPVALGVLMSLALIAVTIGVIALDRDRDVSGSVLPWQWPIDAGEKIALMLSWAVWPLLSAFAVCRRFRGAENLTPFVITVGYVGASLFLPHWFFGWTIDLVSPGVANMALVVVVSAMTGASFAEGERRWRAKMQIKSTQPPPPHRITPDQVAVIMAAYNEEAVIGKTLEALQKNISMANVYVGSDASTDRTVAIARSFGCSVADIFPNRGKAKVLRYLLEEFHICDRYKAVLILDADIVLYPTYLKYVLPHFDDPKVAAVPGRSTPLWRSHWRPQQSMLVTAYRIRLWRMLQFGLRYGQTWRYTNMSTIIPGAMSVYRSSVLRQLHIDAPGLVIEDYNMTFEVQHKRLGRIAYDMRARISAKQPISIQDYTRQVKRWYLGWWQTIRRHGFWPSAFWFFMAAFTLEMVLNGIFLLAIPFLTIVLIAHGFQPVATWELHGVFLRRGLFSLQDIVLGVFLIDYLTTVLVTIIERKPMMLLYGVLFFLFRFIDAIMFLAMIPMSFIARSDGRWVSPKRTEASSA